MQIIVILGMISKETYGGEKSAIVDEQLKDRGV